MQQRRWERALGSAIREGQERGEIAGHGGLKDLNLSYSDMSGAGKHPGIYALTDGTTDAQFESALTTARDEGNVRVDHPSPRCSGLASRPQS